eukprot:m.63953 g.63953  ORF g.63953 m.63953 type:complete len:276 (-) comp7225_c0_seq3:2552-3379(-)
MSGHLLLKLCDFAHSKILAQMPHASSCTVITYDQENERSWTAPEIIESTVMNLRRIPDIPQDKWKRSDMWGLGCLLYFARTSSVTFSSQRTGVILFRTIKESVEAGRDQERCTELVRRDGLERVDPLLFDLISRAIRSDLASRITSEDALYHPRFWSLQFIIELVDTWQNIDSFGNIVRQHLNDTAHSWLPRPEFASLCNHTYDKTKRSELLRFLRSCLSHFGEIPSVAIRPNATRFVLMTFMLHYPDIFIPTHDFLKGAGYLILDRDSNVQIHL